MSNLLGVIKAVIGQVYVVEADGSQRLLKEGDRIYSGEEIVTGASGAVSVALPDGKTLDLGRNSHWSEHGLNAVSSAEHETQDVASLQKAIADGADPTQALEATAAGNEAPVSLEGGGGGHSLVQLDLTGQIIDPTAGFNTAGLGKPAWEINLPENGLTDGGSAPVLPPEVNIDDFAGNDGYINKNEINHTPISGTSNQNHVTLTFTDSQKNTLTIDVPVTNGHWTAQPDLSGLLEGEVTVVATATDVSGRTALSTSESQIDITGPQDHITIDNVTADNIINIEESHNGQTLVHGTVSGDAKLGDPIKLVVDGKEYTGDVIDLGNGKLGYQINVQTQGLLADPNVHATVTSTDTAGNTTQTSTDHHVDIDLDIHNSVTIETVAGDDIVSRNESRMPTMITGKVGGDAQAGDPVTVTVHGQNFHGTVVVDDNGQLRYEIPVPTNLLNEGSNDVQVQVVSHDVAGNEAIAVEHRNVTLDTQAHNALTIETVAGDDTVNQAESRMPTMISGEVTGDAQVGDHVVVSVNGQEFYGNVVVDEHGKLRYEVPVSTNALNEGSNDVQVMVTGVDAVDNVAIAVEHKTVTLDTQAHNALTIETVANEDIVNRTESRMPTMITGEVAGDAQVGDPVAITVNGQNFNGRVVMDEHGKLRYEVPVPTAALHEGSNDVQVTVTGVDASGNTAVAVEHKTVTLDTQSHNALTIETVANDDIVNQAESRMPTLVTGEVSGDAHAGDHVVVSVNGQEFYGRVTDENGHLRYEVPVPTNALNEGSNNVQVMITGTDNAGNTAIAVEHKTVVLDTLAHNSFTIETVAGDDTVNASESRMPTLISGEVTGDAQVGDPVAIDVNGQNFNGRVVMDEHGKLRYEVAVPTAALHEGANDVQVTVTGVDASGNTAVAVEHKTVTLDTQASNGFTIETVAGDDTVNASESRMPTLISGEVSGDAHAGDHVVVSVNGQEFYGRVTDENGHLRYEVPVPTNALNEGANNVQVMITGTDNAGNTAIAVEHKTVTLDTQASNGFTIETVAGDDTVNANESRMPTMISGEVSGDAHAGDQVVVSVNGQEFYGRVTDENGHLRYEVPVPTNALNEGSNGVQVMITGTDNAGNTAIAVNHTTVTLDTLAHNAVTIETVATDDIVNTAESRMPTMITGEVTGDAQVGDPVAVDVNGQNFNGRVVMDEHGKLRYEVAVPTSALQEGANDVQVTVTGVDASGNTAVAVEHKTVTLDTQAHNALTIETVATDDIVNTAEFRMPTMITGEVTGDAQVGDPVAITVNGQTFNGLVVDDHGKLRYEVPVPTAALHEGANDVQVTVTGVDASGNTAVAVEHKTVTLDTLAHNAVTIETVADDNTVNASESRMPTLITGEVTGDAQVGDPVAITVNGQTFNGLVVDDHGKLRYEVAVPTSALQEGANDVQVTVTGIDASGNTAVAVEHTTVTLDTLAHNAVTIETVAGEDTVNANESRMPTLITGEVTGEAQVGDPVAITVNGQTFNGLVVDDQGKLRYEVPVPTAALHEGANDVQVTVTGVDASGNTAVAVEHKTVTLDTQAHNALTIETVAGDNTVNANESRMPTFISGEVTGDAQAGDGVVVSVNGQEFYGNVVVDEHGKLRYEVPVPTSALNEGTNDVQVMVTGVDNAGNTAIAVEHKTIVLDTQAHNSVTINTVAGDNIVNNNESHRDTLITGHVSGKDAQAGDHVVVLVQGKQFPGEVFVGTDGHLHYKVAVPTGVLHEGNNDVQVMVISHDTAGNEAIAVEHKNVTLDTHADATISVDSVTKDNVLNHDELNTSKQFIHGTVGGDARLNDVVDLEINGQHYHGNVISLGGNKLGYNIAVDPSAFSDNQGKVDRDVTVKATVHAHDDVGNEVAQTNTSTVHIDNHAEATITIKNATSDNFLNHSELSKAQQTISGEVGGDAKLKDPVSLEVNGKTFYGEVVTLSNGHLGYHIKVDSSAFSDNQGEVDDRVKVHATIKSHDTAGNEVIQTAEHTVHIDNHANATISIDDVTKDNVLNHSELNQAHQTITGTVGGDAQVNDAVVLKIGDTVIGHGKVVDLDGKGALGFRIDVDSSAFSDNKGQVLNDVKFTAAVTSHDGPHNEVTVITEHTVHIDNFAVNHQTINTIAGDDVVNNHESKHETLITGIVNGKDAQDGNDVVVTVQGQDYSGKVLTDANGHLYYKVAVPVGVLHEGANNVQVKVTSHDDVGNSVTATEHRTVTLDSHADATITVDSVTKDNILNHDELNASKQWVHGTVGGDARLNDVVDLEINGQHYHGNVISLGGTQLGYNISVDPSAFDNNQKDADHDVTVTASVKSHDAAGNETVQTTTHNVHVDNHADAAITINSVTGDDTINHAESRQQVTRISGTVSGDVSAGDNLHEGDKVTITVNNHTYETTVVKLPHSNALGYNVDVNTRDLLADPHVTAHITGHDSVGNVHTVEVTKDLKIDLHADATITIDPVTANHDNMINEAESKSQFTTVSGTVGGDVKAGDLVHIHVNGLDLTTKVVLENGKLVYHREVSTHDLITDPHLTATVTATDDANNFITVEAKQDIVVDTRVEAVITVDSVTPDNTLNGEELDHQYTLVSGKVTGEMKVGDPLTLTVNGQTYHGNVEDLGNNQMGYHVMVSTTDLHQNPNIHASIDVTDDAKNHTVATTDHHVNIDESAHATLTINVVSGDDVLNGHDLAAPNTTINGVVGGNVHKGDVVHVLVNGVTYNATVGPQAYLNGALGYSVDVKTSDLAANPHIIAHVETTDGAGNHASATTTIT